MSTRSTEQEESDNGDEDQEELGEEDDGDGDQDDLVEEEDGDENQKDLGEEADGNEDENASREEDDGKEQWPDDYGDDPTSWHWVPDPDATEERTDSTLTLSKDPLHMLPKEIRPDRLIRGSIDEQFAPEDPLMEAREVETLARLRAPVPSKALRNLDEPMSLSSGEVTAHRKPHRKVPKQVQQGWGDEAASDGGYEYKDSPRNLEEGNSTSFMENENSRYFAENKNSRSFAENGNSRYFAENKNSVFAENENSRYFAENKIPDLSRKMEIPLPSWKKIIPDPGQWGKVKVPRRRVNSNLLKARGGTDTREGGDTTNVKSQTLTEWQIYGAWRESHSITQ
jgi:hypothetical protein